MNSSKIIAMFLIVSMGLVGCSPGPEDSEDKKKKQIVSTANQLPMVRNLELQAAQLRESGHNLKMALDNLDKEGGNYE